MTSIQEMQWVLRAQCRDRAALEALLRGVQPSVRRYLSGVAGATEADDLLQNVLVIIARRIGSLDDPKLFRPWTFRIASREAFRHVRKRRLWIDRHDDDARLDELATPDVRPEGELLRELLASGVISPASRAVLILRYEEELPLGEIAAILDIPLGTVKSRLAYGLNALRQQFKTPGGSHD